MNARPLPPPAPDPTRKKIRLTEITEKAMRQPFVAKIQSIANASALRTHLNTVMKTRWLRITGIVVGVLLVILLALPLFINVNSFRPKIESELTNAWDGSVTLGDSAFHSSPAKLAWRMSASPTIRPLASRRS